MPGLISADFANTRSLYWGAWTPLLPKQANKTNGLGHVYEVFVNESVDVGLGSGPIPPH